MLQQDEPDDFVVATGETHAVSEFVELAFTSAGIDDWEKYVRIDPRFFRPAEVDLLVGDATKAKTTLGWEPKVSFRELVAMMVDHDLGIEQSKLS
jgi:GDPmannose 4,6-dehydratase